MVSQWVRTALIHTTHKNILQRGYVQYDIRHPPAPSPEDNHIPPTKIYVKKNDQQPSKYFAIQYGRSTVCCCMISRCVSWLLVYQSPLQRYTQRDKPPPYSLSLPPPTRQGHQHIGVRVSVSQHYPSNGNPKRGIFRWENQRAEDHLALRKLSSNQVIMRT